MSKIDEVKEILNTLRVLMSLTVGILVLIVGKMVVLYDTNQFGEVFWLTIAAGLADLVALLLIIWKIALKTREIRDL